jgi:LPXTG-motif cell wall-anchored protein
MSAKILVTLAGLGLIVLVLWYFFPRSRKKA